MKVKNIVFCRASDISAIISHGNEITNFVMKNTGKWEEISGNGIFSVNFIQIPELINGRYVIGQQTNIDCAKNDENTEAFGLLSQSCELVFVNYLETGGALAQGIELDIIASGGFTKSKISEPRFKSEVLILGIAGKLLCKSTTLAAKIGMTKEQLLML